MSKPKRQSTPTPKPRGRQGGRKSKFGTPMVSKSLRMREDTWKMICDGAEAESIKQGRKVSQGEWIMMQLYPPHIWALLNHEPQNATLSHEEGGK